MYQKTIFIGFIAALLLILPAKVARAQFFSLDPVGIIDGISFISGYVPLPAIANASIFALELATVPLRTSSNEEVENRPPNIVEVSDLYNSESESLLFPESDDKEHKNFQSFVKKLSAGQYDFGPISWAYKSRTILGTGGKADNSLIGESYYNSDSIENYVKFAPSSTSSLYIGRKNNAFGHSLGINPASVFYFSRPANYNLPLERKHLEGSGVDSIGMDYHNSNIGNLSVIVAPSVHRINDNNDNRFYASYGTLVGSEPIDLRLFGFYEDEPLIGVSINAPAPQGFTLYTDLTLEQGAGIQRVLEESAAGTIELDKEESSQFITNLTIGMNYTIGRNILINAEYSHLSNGYDETEWSNYYAALEDSGSGGKKLKNGVFTQLVENYESSYLRSDYGLLRFYDQDTLGSGIRTEITTLLGLNDFSGRVDLNLGRNLTDAYSVELYAGYNFGSSDGEFTFARENIIAGASIVAKY